MAEANVCVKDGRNGIGRRGLDEGMVVHRVCRHVPLPEWGVEEEVCVDGCECMMRSMSSGAM